MEQHTPERPVWKCRTCGEPWPCDARKILLRAEVGRNPSPTLLFLATQYWAAIEDSYGHPELGPGPSNLRERFMGWVSNSPYPNRVI